MSLSMSCLSPADTQPKPQADPDRDEDVVNLVDDSVGGLDVCLDHFGVVDLHSAAW